MKIHKQEATFQPIAIILESQEEVDVITAVFANISGTGKIRTEIIDKLYYALKEHVKYDFRFKGELFLE